ncbi:uncharacterized protein SPSK_06474 [Sporothrix schenckii 1099-18]|uniref:Protein kinase domain-containing protein n=1 Tax=Sporothrix schenckii 1099-18 TaxID=1397361 RepID=A0A0F2MJH8_SPOSC|nr:uncharacterized protein SPSK_06474 [Sporothrix schenckii 1099-18]KJR89219.1 hypothetical protein SPSK_06474 [Sporothrix schenckii 1099-18]
MPHGPEVERLGRHLPAVDRAAMARIVSQEELKNAKRFGPFVPVFQIDPETIVKTGQTVRSCEAETMKFVRDRTSIPVPQVYNAYTDDTTGHVRIVMEFVEGRNLDRAWETYTDSEKQSVVSQLRKYMDELRQITGSYIGSVDGSWCNDHYFDNERGAYGPFANEDEFNEGIVRALRKSKPYDWVEYYCDIFKEVMVDHKIVMTHNDMDPRNIIVQGSKVVALLDWELSGYFPEYWEYCKAMRRPDWESAWVKERVLEKIMKPYRKEMSVIWNTTEIIW